MTKGGMPVKKIADYDIVKKMIQTVSPTVLEQDVGITRSSVYHYRNGDYDIGNMPFKDAVALTTYARKGDINLDNTDVFLIANRNSVMIVDSGEQVEVPEADTQFRTYPDVCVLWIYNNDGEPVRTVRNPVSGTALISPEECYEAERQLRARIDFHGIDPEFVMAARHYYNGLGEPAK